MGMGRVRKIYLRIARVLRKRKTSVVGAELDKLGEERPGRNYAKKGEAALGGRTEEGLRTREKGSRIAPRRRTAYKESLSLLESRASGPTIGDKK